MQIIDYLKSNPEAAYQYAKMHQIQQDKFKQELIKTSEEVILSHPDLCVRYAIEVANGRWEKGEKTISKDIFCSYNYAKDILKDRFKLAEKLISQDSEYAYRYAKDVLKKRWAFGEDAISKDPAYSYEYAKNVLKKRFIKGEDVISNEPQFALYYAVHLLNKKLPIKMHNKMIAMAIQNPEDIYIKEYFNFIKFDGKLEKIIINPPF
jgi:hypothetical protein